MDQQVASSFYLNDLFGYVVVFMRLGAFIFLMPGLSEAYVPPNIRLVLTLVFSVVLTPLLSANLPTLPVSPGDFFLILMGEFLIGLFAGLIIRFLMAAFDLAGSLLGFQMNLANAFVQSPASAQQTSLPAAFLGLIATVMIFAMNLHHLMFTALYESFETLKPGTLLHFEFLIQDMTHQLTTYLNASFLLAVKIAAPVVLISMLVMIAVGILNRLVPQIQIFFIVQPLQIFIGFIVLMVSLAVIMNHFLDRLAQAFIRLWG